MERSSFKLQQLCIKYQWFTEGTNSQYEKLFYAYENGASLEEIVTIIWLCSDTEKWCHRDIKDILLKEIGEVIWLIRSREGGKTE